MSIKAIDWVTNWNGFIGNLSGARASAWLEVINANIYDLRQSEIDNAVARICQLKRDKGDPEPNVRTIMSYIRSGRGMSNAHGYETPNNVAYYDSAGQMCQITMAELKQMLNRRPPPDEAWEIICTPLMTEQCRELEEYAKRSNIAFERLKPNTNQQISKVSEAICTR